MINPGQPTVMRPGGHHIMLMGAKRLIAGEMIDLKLEFDSQILDISVPVVSIKKCITEDDLANHSCVHGQAATSLPAEWHVHNIAIGHVLCLKSLIAFNADQQKEQHSKKTLQRNQSKYRVSLHPLV